MPASILWLSDGTFTFNGQEIQMSSFLSNFIHGMLADAQRILRDKLLFTTNLPKVPLVRIADDIPNTTFGYSFMTDPRNVALFSRGFSILKSRSLPAEDLPEYINHVNSFPELILILSLTTSDHPSHSYDLTCLFLLNTQFYAHSPFIMSEEYGPSHYGNAAIIITVTLVNEPPHRFLPADVSTLLVLYLLDVLPLLRRHRRPAAAAAVGHEALVRSNYFFSEGSTHWSEARYARILKRESKQRLGVEMDLAGYKTVFLAVSKKFNPGRFDDEGNCLV